MKAKQTLTYYKLTVSIAEPQQINGIINSPVKCTYWLWCWYESEPLHKIKPNWIAISSWNNSNLRTLLSSSNSTINNKNVRKILKLM